MKNVLKPDIALARDEASRFLPWIIALMVYLAALTLAGGFTLNRTVEAGHNAELGSFSVHLPHDSEHAGEISAKALSLIRETRGVGSAELLGTERIRQMVAPWLGDSASIASLPLPIVIEGKVAPDGSVDYAALRTALSRIAPGADIDDHKQWIAQFSHVVHTVQWVLFAIAVIIILATASVVVFACKTSLKIHRATVNLLHRLGAMDSYIARQFQGYAAYLALRGAFVGSGFAAGTLLVLHIAARHIDSPLFPAFALTFEHWVILLSLPVLMSLLALLAARSSVLSTLRRMP